MINSMRDEEQNMENALTKCIRLLVSIAAVSILFIGNAVAQDVGNAGSIPRLDSVEPDLQVPSISDMNAAPGRRVFVFDSNKKENGLYHCLYLPKDWNPSHKYPLLVEFGGNQHTGKLGDISTGLPEDCSLGFGLSAGVGCIWVSLPFVDHSGTKVTKTWWGDPPNYNPQPTMGYCLKTIDSICEQYGADRNRIILCGFSRGAIACNYLGLQNEEIAKTWKGFFVYSHYDGVRNWPFTQSESGNAASRLARLKGRKQFVCDEDLAGLKRTELLISQTVSEGNITYASTGFQNHSDKWILRPSPTRELAREWLAKVLQDSSPQ
jgi:hypothetical protein